MHLGFLWLPSNREGETRQFLFLIFFFFSFFSNFEKHIIFFLYSRNVQHTVEVLKDGKGCIFVLLYFFKSFFVAFFLDVFFRFMFYFVCPSLQATKQPQKMTKFPIWNNLCAPNVYGCDVSFFECNWLHIICRCCWLGKTREMEI